MEDRKFEVSSRILLSDLDSISQQYRVVDAHGYSIGEKSLHFGYLKPEYSRNGRRTGGRSGGVDARFYKAAPPWLKLEVFKIDNLGGDITFHVKSKEEQE